MNLIEMVKAAGVVGAGGAGFPTHVKLNTNVEYFIVNAAECEPLIETDKYLCRTFADRIIRTIPQIAEAIGASKKVIALKGAYEKEIAALKVAIREQNSDVEIFELGYFYPAGDEQTLIQQVTGRCVPERGLPSDVGCVVDNVGTVLNIADALEGKAVTEKYLSVVGEVEHPLQLRVPIGTSVLECVKAAHPTVSDFALIMGGPMMGKQLTEQAAMEQAVVTKTTGNILVLPKDHYLFRKASLPMETVRKQTKSACLQCKMCTELCPRYLIGHQIHPNLMMRGLWLEPTITDNEEYLRMYGEAANCCSCGVCEMFSCPMGLSPRQVNDYMKVQLRERGIMIDKTPDPTARPTIDLNRIPTDRLIARLGLGKYNGLHAHSCTELFPREVFIPLSQHIGKPAAAVVKAGDTIHKGDLIGQADEKALSANIHASVNGTVTEAAPNGIRINVN